MNADKRLILSVALRTRVHQRSLKKYCFGTAHQYVPLTNALNVKFFDSLTEGVLGAVFEVSNTLGAGCLEKVYERALLRELSFRGIRAAASFIVVSGMSLDLGALLHDKKSLLMMPLFLLLFLVVRGVPVVLYRNDIAKNERLPFVLYSGTALPLVVAITNIGVRTGQLRADMAASLVGAGVLSVLLFPTLAGTLLARNTIVVRTDR